MHDTKRLLSAIEYGDGQAAEQLLPLIYDELHRLAAELVGRDGRGKPSKPRTWSTRPISASWSRRETQHWQGRAHFLAAAAEAMRRILVEHARRRRAAKYGGGWHRIPLDDVQVADRQHDGNRADVILAIDEALKRFAAEDPVKAELVILAATSPGSLSKKPPVCWGSPELQGQTLLVLCPGMALRRVDQGRFGSGGHGNIALLLKQ